MMKTVIFFTELEFTSNGGYRRPEKIVNGVLRKKEREKQREKEREKQTDRQTETDRKTDRQRQTDRQTDIGFVASKPNYHQGHFKVQKDFN